MDVAGRLLPPHQRFHARDEDNEAVADDLVAFDPYIRDGYVRCMAVHGNRAPEVDGGVRRFVEQRDVVASDGQARQLSPPIGREHRLQRHDMHSACEVLDAVASNRHVFDHTVGGGGAGVLDAVIDAHDRHGAVQHAGKFLAELTRPAEIIVADDKVAECATLPGGSDRAEGDAASIMKFVAGHAHAGKHLFTISGPEGKRRRKPLERQVLDGDIGAFHDKAKSSDRRAFEKGDSVHCVAHVICAVGESHAPSADRVAIIVPQYRHQAVDDQRREGLIGFGQYLKGKANGIAPHGKADEISSRRPGRSLHLPLLGLAQLRKGQAAIRQADGFGQREAFVADPAKAIGIVDGQRSARPDRRGCMAGLYSADHQQEGE